MTDREDTFTPFDEVLAEAELDSPWSSAGEYRPDHGLLERLVSLPIAAGATTPTGRFPKAFDAWVAHELRRAGFDPDEVWPRATRPRVLPSDVRILLERIVPARSRRALEDFLASHSRAAAVAPVEARVLGRVYTKQSDVLIAQWARGVELLVSTKTMVSSYGNNLRNRFEESYGDAVNLRGRFPLASLGFLYAVRTNIPPADHAFLVDMLAKLREPAGYDATCLIVLEWDTGSAARLHSPLMPPDLSPARFLSDLITAVLDRTPADHHVAVRKRLPRL